jgi:hypothetical protein
VDSREIALPTEPATVSRSMTERTHTSSVAAALGLDPALVAAGRARVPPRATAATRRDALSSSRPHSSVSAWSLSQ